MGLSLGAEVVGSYSPRCRFTVSTIHSPQVTLHSVPRRLYLSLRPLSPARPLLLPVLPFSLRLCLSQRTLDGIINHFAEPFDRKQILYASFVPVIVRERSPENYDQRCSLRPRSSATPRICRTFVENAAPEVTFRNASRVRTRHLREPINRVCANGAPSPPDGSIFKGIGTGPSVDLGAAV